MVAVIAVYGGDGRGVRGKKGVRHYPSTKRGGNRRLRNLVEAIKRGGIDTLYILARWVGHSAVRRLKSVCEAHGVRFIETRESRPRRLDR